MKLNPDCVRDILVYLEEKLDYIDDGKTSSKINRISWQALLKDESLLKCYHINEIKYSIQKLAEIKYLEVSKSTGSNNGWLTCDICDITWNGHEFLNTIRSQTIWEASKEKATRIGSMSIRTLSTLAMTITKAIITNPEFIGDMVCKFGV